MAMTSPFRRAAAVESKKKGGRGGGSWRDRFKMPQNSPTPFVLVAGDYVDQNPPAELIEVDPATGRAKEVKNAFHKRRKHKHKVPDMQYPIDEECSAGENPHSPQPCVGCFAIDQGNKAVTVGDAFSFTLVHLAPYHSAPVIQDNGQVMMKKDNSGPVLNYFECEGRVCNFCRVQAGHPPVQQQGQAPWPNYHPQSIGNVFGRRRYLEIGKGHLSNLEGWDLTISSLCGRCNSQLVTDGFACPTCNNLIIDMSSDPRTDAQIQEAVAKPYPCMHCQRAMMAKEVTSCDVCAQQNAAAIQQGLFDVVIWGMRQGEGTKSQLMMSRFESIEAFEQKLQPGYRAAMQNKPLRQYLTEELLKPFNFDEMFKPKNLQDQAKRLRLPVPGGFIQQTQGYGGYQQQQAPQQPQFYGAPPQYVSPPQMPSPVAPPPQYQPQQGQQFQQFQPVPQTPPQPQPQFAPYPQPQQAPNNQPGPSPFATPGKPNFSA